MINFFKKNSLKLLLSLCLAVAVGFVATNVYAAEKNIGDLTVSWEGEGPLFNELNIAPGFETTKKITVQNDGSVNHSFSIAIDGKLGGLADVLYVEPIVDGEAVWYKALSAVAQKPNTDVVLGSIPAGETQTVDMKVSMPQWVGNDYQGKSTFAFDFLVGEELSERGGQDIRYASVVNGRGDLAAVNMTEGPDESGRSINAPEVDLFMKNNATNAEEGAAQLEGSALGETINKVGVCFWWWVLLIVLGALIALFEYFYKRDNVFIKVFWATFFAAVLYTIHWILHDYYWPSEIGRYFPIYEIIIILLYWAYAHRKRALKKG